MYSVLITIHIIVCVLLVLVVMIQAGRSGGLAGLMGGGGGDALFSTASQQAGLRKTTVVVAIVFMVTSSCWFDSVRILLAFLIVSVLQGENLTEEEAGSMFFFRIGRLGLILSFTNPAAEPIGPQPFHPRSRDTRETAPPSNRNGWGRHAKDCRS